MESLTMWVRPERAGLRVIDPATGVDLPMEGALVPRNGYWTRRVHEGSCVVINKESPEGDTEV